MTNNQLPIKHLSFSSMKQLMSNPWMFYVNRVLGQWDEFKTSPALLIGKAVHYLIEGELTNRPDFQLEVKQLIVRGYHDRNFEAGSTSMQEITDTVFRCYNAYKEFGLDLGAIVAIEHTIDCPYVTSSGVKGPINLKAIPDLVSEKDGEYMIWDWKTVSQFTDLSKENPDYILQGMFYYHAVYQYYGKAPTRITFVEIHKKGSLQLWEVVYDNYPHYFEVFDKLYIEVVKDLMTRQSWLPSFAGFFDKEQTWESYVSHIND